MARMAGSRVSRSASFTSSAGEAAVDGLPQQAEQPVPDVFPAPAHHWAREIAALGHQVRLMPAAYVKPYVKRRKTDAADAEAIAEAVTRPTMRYVAVKTTEQQAVLMLHKTRDLLVRQRTMLINALRGHLGEYGVVTAKGPERHRARWSDQGADPRISSGPAAMRCAYRPHT
jgi:transposase